MQITITENGPYKVEGAEGIELVGPDGAAVPVTRDTIYYSGPVNSLRSWWCW